MPAAAELLAGSAGSTATAAAAAGSEYDDDVFDEEEQEYELDAGQYEDALGESSLVTITMAGPGH